jgi:hypothetical protein
MEKNSFRCEITRPAPQLRDPRRTSKAGELRCGFGEHRIRSRGHSGRACDKSGSRGSGGGGVDRTGKHPIGDTRHGRRRPRVVRPCVRRGADRRIRRLSSETGSRAPLYAKCMVVDGSATFVTSANFTSGGSESQHRGRHLGAHPIICRCPGRTI